jgi:hypothetical protein
MLSGRAPCRGGSVRRDLEKCAAEGLGYIQAQLSARGLATARSWPHSCNRADRDLAREQSRIDEQVAMCNRILACEMAGVEPTWVKVTDEDIKDGDLIRHVLSLNVNRKSKLTPHQAAVAAAKIANFPHGRSEGKVPRGTLVSRDEAAKRVGASLTNVARALRVYNFHKSTPCQRLVDVMEDSGDT